MKEGRKERKDGISQEQNVENKKKRKKGQRDVWKEGRKYQRKIKMEETNAERKESIKE